MEGRVASASAPRMKSYRSCPPSGTLTPLPLACAYTPISAYSQHGPWEQADAHTHSPSLPPQSGRAGGVQLPYQATEHTVQLASSASTTRAQRARGSYEDGGTALTSDNGPSPRPSGSKLATRWPRLRNALTNDNTLSASLVLPNGAVRRRAAVIAVSGRACNLSVAAAAVSSPSPAPASARRCAIPPTQPSPALPCSQQTWHHPRQRVSIS